MSTKRILILGAAGRDFHNFNCLFRGATSSSEIVVGFTASQIPHIDKRTYPASIAGPSYPDGLPIWSEDELEQIIRKEKVDKCILSYSDLSYDVVMGLATRVLSSGSEFSLVPPDRTMISGGEKPVIAICAVRTGCGKSQVSRYLIEALKERGKKAVLVRHPMPYGDLAKQAVQRFESYEDLEKHGVTLEEREEYEQHLATGTIVYAGVDYHAIYEAAMKEAVDVVIWDGGNNDTPFFKPDLWICIADPHRLGHESRYYPGDLNFRMADVVVINKANTAPEGSVEVIRTAAGKLNPEARVYVTDSVVTVDRPELIEGKKVLLIEDGPTLTHGGMKYGAGRFAASAHSATPVDPRPYLTGSIKQVFEKFPHLGHLVPAMGYWPEQLKDLEETIEKTECEAVVVATPMDLRRLIRIGKPCVVASYEINDRVGGGRLGDEVDRVLGGEVKVDGK